MLNGFTSVAFVTVLTACVPRPEASAHVPSHSRERIFSTEGFSFLPPQQSNWDDEFGKNNDITYTKLTDPHTVTFYAGAIEGKLLSTLPDKAALVAYVRSKKDEWGDDGRYANIVSSFQVEAKQESCVRYRLSANDRGAKNRGRHSFVPMLAVGRFCLHPQDRTSAVDIYYSVRQVPPFDPKDLIAEGEEFLKSLQFSDLPDRSNKHDR